MRVLWYCYDIIKGRRGLWHLLVQKHLAAGQKQEVLAGLPQSDWPQLLSMAAGLYFISLPEPDVFQISKNSLQKQYYCQKLSKCEHSGSKLAAKLIIAMLQPSASAMASNCQHVSVKQDLDQDCHFCPCCLTQLLWNLGYKLLWRQNCIYEQYMSTSNHF